MPKLSLKCEIKIIIDSGQNLRQKVNNCCNKCKKQHAVNSVTFHFIAP